MIYRVREKETSRARNGVGQKGLKKEKKSEKEGETEREKEGMSRQSRRTL